MYDEIINSLKPVWYTDSDLLTNDLITNNITRIENNYINTQNNSLEDISRLITQLLNSVYIS